MNGMKRRPARLSIASRTNARMFLAGALVLGGLALACTAGSGSQPPTVARHGWPTLMHDGHRTGRSPYRGPTQPRKKWTKDLGGLCTSDPAVGPDGTVYVGVAKGRSPGVLCALTAGGRKQWEFRAATPPGYSGQEPLSVWSSPALASDGTIYCTAGQRLYALRANGSEKWHFETGPPIRSRDVIGRVYRQWASSSPALGTDGTIYFGGSDGFLYAVTPNGAKKWAFQAGAVVSCSPGLANDGTIYFGDERGRLYALSRGGSLKWRRQVERRMPSHPVIGDDGTVYALGEGRFSPTAPRPDHWDPNSAEYRRWRGGPDWGLATLFAFREDGSVIWKRRCRSDTALALNLDGSLVSASTQLLLLDKGGAVERATAIGDDGWGCTVDRQGTVYLQSTLGLLRALSPAGKEKWRLRLWPEGDINEGSLTPVIAGDGLICVVMERQLIAIGNRDT